MKRIFYVTTTACFFVLGLLIGGRKWSFILNDKWAETATAVSAIIGALVATAALLVAMWAVYSQRQSARAQHTISHLSDSARDKDIIEAKRIFFEKANLPGGLAKYAHKENCKTEAAICTVLNHYELISLGIQCGTIDYEVFKNWNKSTVLKVWNSASPFVAETRKVHKSPLLWYEFEHLAADFSGVVGPKRKIRSFLRFFF